MKTMTIHLECTEKCDTSLQLNSYQNSVVQLRSLLTLSTTFSERFLQFFCQVFLPQGYPESVSDDYYKYQIWDTVQAFCSTITGTLTTQAVMKGVGVGDTAATPFAAAVTWILKDGTGMVGRIAFAWFEGSRLDGDCKKWRLFADVLNDMAMAFELLVPVLMTYSTHILCIATALKSIVGVAGGATRAAITQHQAIRNNMADVSAKDGSQETFVNLCASFVGIIILSTLEGEFVWHLFTVFTVIHLYANYQAVLSLKMVTLNNARLILLLRMHLGMKIVSSPEVINRHEPVILGTGMSDRNLCGFRIILGASLQNAMAYGKICTEDIKLLTGFYCSKKYLIIVDIKGKRMFVTFLQGETAVDVIQAYFHAVLLGIAICIIREHPLMVLNEQQSRSSLMCPVHHLQETLIKLNTTNTISRNMKIPVVAMKAADDIVSKEFPEFLEAIQKQGWNTRSHHITVDEWRSEWSNFDKNE
ncbi:RUS1 family protein C16orf58 isoform X2 [Zootermopsis nevadensis]|uniref:RUS1 family protein C16orf58 isoform X2 n=1 Tax=Zootermopsis nevadensis TaxID=136037 RepID=UPI000B8E2CE2|nr:RUS1 family protein C16orf58 isoform X2 [Zootermopsis nevadensis]XP_021922644.1 RUS1 family protein C16orf58 isoform X2 [Zootermopsis nevadensis]XP_021922645.1 RUS1 family protein C16orf58 isoform X2 [Zootermopsis nevadensis]XP_021922646.1 RUS1 family protein C16orf58 isoform X2 [Zootermopsis nevadensis]